MTRERAVDMAVAQAHRSIILVATCSDIGEPHLAAAGSIRKLDESHLAVTDWFCPGTVANATSGSFISIVVWDFAADKGHQIIGRVVAMETLAMLNGYVPGQEESILSPQERRRLVIEVEKVLDFKQKPHSDTEE